MREEKILIVEDEVIIALDIKSKVENFGFRVVGIVNSGQQALEKAGQLKPDLVLMDILIFGPMDGIETAQRIRETYHIPVIYLTAHADDKTMSRALVTDPFGYVCKPLKDRELLGAVEIALYKHRLEKELETSQRRWESTFNAISDWVSLINVHSNRIEQTNSQTMPFVGLPHSGMPGRTCCSMLHASDDPIEGCPVQIMLRTKRRETLEFYDSDRDRWFLVIADPVFDQTGQIQSAVHIVREITEQKRGEALLRSERDKFVSILSAIGEGVAIVDDAYKLEYQNDISQKLFGDGIGRIGQESLRYGVQICSVLKLQEIFQDGRIRTFETVLPDGRIFEITGSPFSGVHGRKMILMLQKDISEKKALQVESVRAAHMQSLGELAAGVAHEINNPITGIINCAQLMEDGKETGDLPRRIIQEGERVARIVKNLLAFARNDREEKNPAAVASILDDTVGLIRSQMQKQGIELKADFQTDLPDVVVNRYQIQQVFLNIIQNAIYALNQKYPDADPDKLILIRSVFTDGDQGRTIRTEFEDHGQGIPAQNLKKVMDPFFTTKNSEGTGLGLSICQKIIKEHGGRLFIESKEGKYTRVIVDLPARREAA
jgi:signal transduction histidine kinase/CheY-like chemotaxis protein